MLTLHRLCFHLLLGYLLCSSSWAGLPRTLRFEQLNVAHGLAQESVLAIVQDKHGFMWFGSQGGLSRYDGYRFVNYKYAVNDPHGLADNWVRVLHIDPAGQLWVGTDGGLDRYDAATQSFTHFVPLESAKRGNGNRHIRAIIDDGAHGLWIGTGDGLQYFDTVSGRFTIWHHDQADPGSLQDDQINALALDGERRLWIGTASGLDRLVPGANRIEHHSLGTSAKPNAVQTLLIDSEQVLWIGGLSGIQTLNLKNGLRRNMGQKEGFVQGSIKSLYQDTDGDLWLGSESDGLYRWLPQEDRFVRYRHQPIDQHSIADNYVSALFRDRTGTFWVGTWYAGVSRADLASGGFSRYGNMPDERQILSDNKVRAIADAGDGGLWFGTNSGLSRFNPASGEVLTYRHDPGALSSLSDDQVSAILRDKGNLWVGGRAGLNKLDLASGRFSRQSFARGDSESDQIRGIIADRAGILWIASRGGLHRFDPGSGRRQSYRHDPADSASLADNIVRPLLEDRRNVLWIGTFNGLDQMDRDSGRFKNYRHDPKDPNSLSHNEVHYLFEDSSARIWVGTAGGLNLMERTQDGAVRFRRYAVKDGLADDSIAAILEDEVKQLWLSTNSGISRLDPATGKIRNYNAGDGTIEGAYFDGSALRAPDGTFYFGGFNGVTAFVPKSIHDNPVAPVVVITDFQIFNKSIQSERSARPGLLQGALEDSKLITLNSADSVFSLEFSALHYAAPQRNRFAYQLQGFDKDWVMTDASKRFATYTNLDPGNYLFRVKAANKDGVWNETGASLAITILPPYWKTWWFRTLVTLLGLGMILSAYRLRMRALHKQKTLLERQVMARTTEVEQKNCLLERQKEELEQRRQEAENQRADAEQRHLESERQKQEVEQQKENVELAHRNISVLSEIGRELTASLDMETIMSTVYRHVNQLMDTHIFGIGFYREEKGIIEFPFGIENGIRNRPYSRNIENPNQLAVWCLKNRREIFINDLDAEYRQYIDASSISTLAVAPPDGSDMTVIPQSIMYALLIVKERVMGMLCVQSVVKNAYRRVHMDMLQTLAAHAAVALDNASAYQQLEHTQSQLLLQEKQILQHTDELAFANSNLLENEERLRHAKQKAEDATRQKSEFLANMSHEMRTPLAGVIGMLGFALRDTRLTEDTREQLLRGQSNAKSLLTIINDLLDFSKIEAGKLSIENIDFALSASIETVGSLFEEQASARSLDFAVVLDSDLPLYVLGDPTRLRQILVNLVGNAFKFTHHGAIVLRVERVADGQSPDQINRIRFSVQDSGIGITAEACTRLFQKFEQADSTTTRRYGGTGLGLAICRQLVELMGGEISVTSTPGVGSTFSFVLPLADGVAPPQVPDIPRAPHSHKLKVLCAEDFLTNQIIIRTLLEDLGHDCEIVNNGLLAVQACAQQRFDLILMDGRMPEMDGATATRLIRTGGLEQAPVRDQELMIVALTANASEEDRSRYIAAGMDDFLSKPIDEAALHFQISRAIERQLQRGVALEPMPEMLPKSSASGEYGSASLDAMFGINSLASTPIIARPVIRSPGELKSRLRRAFAGDVPGRLAELEQAMLRLDHETAGRLLHGFKGSAAYLEELELQALCSELEVAADQQQWTVLQLALPALRQLLANFETAG